MLVASVGTQVLLGSDEQGTGKAVVFTAIAMFADMPGVPPGLLIRRMTNLPKAVSLGPMM